MKEGGIAMKMKGVFAGVVLSALTLQAANVDRILVRQQWPWNEKVAIDFVLTGVAGKMEIDCAVYRGVTSAFAGCDVTHRQQWHGVLARPWMQP